jgi:hypothetical protein
VNRTEIPIAQIKKTTKKMAALLSFTSILFPKMRKPSKITVPQINRYSFGALNGSASFGFIMRVINPAE